MSGARTVLVNSAWMVGAEVATRLLSLATILYLSRTLAPDGVGTVEFGMAVFGLLHLVTMNGVEARLVPAMVRAPEDVTRLAGRSLLLAWGQLVIVLAGFLAIARAVGVSDAMWTAALVFGSAAVVAPFALRFAAIGGERMWPIGVGLVAGACAYLGLTVALVTSPDHALRVGGCWALAMIVRAAIPYGLFVRREGRPQLDAGGLGPELLRTAGLGVGGVARGLMATIDVIVLGILTHPEAVASYGLAAKVPLFLATLIAMFHTALFPSIVRAFAVGDRVRVRRVAGAVLDVSLGLALPTAVCLGAVAGVVATVLFTDRFPDAGWLMALLLARLPLSAASGLFRTLVWAQSPARDARVAVQVLVATLTILVVATAWYGTAGTVAGMLCGDVIALGLYARHAAIEGVGRLLVPVRALGATALALGALLALPADGGPMRVLVAGTVWTVAVAVAVGPRLGALRRLLDDGAGIGTGSPSPGRFG